jgi:two-component system, OmpR family, phosphate regulon sensor histidine kinase PhoR
LNPINPVRFSLIIALSIGLVSGIMSFFIPGTVFLKLALMVVMAGTCFLICYYSIKLFFYDRIEDINVQIMGSLKNTNIKTRVQSRGDDPLEKLNSYVKRLIREKTIEIDNLKELERMRKEFLGDVAHELRSPIFNVQGYIHTLMEGAMEDEEVRTRFLNKAAKHVDHLSILVEDLVTISRIEAGELKLEFTDFDIKELIQEVIDLLDHSARQKSISLVTKYPTEPALMVHADLQKIRQVLVNLINNSIKYGRENGITTISLLDAHNDITVEVADNGEGIAKEHLPRIFERFYRVDKARQRSEPSTGLGLAIVKHFVEAHKQKILVTSREGVGSIFSFTLAKSKLQ